MTRSPWLASSAMAVVLVAGCSTGEPVRTASEPAGPPTASTGLPQGWPSTSGPPLPARTAGTPTSQTRTVVPTVVVLPSGRQARVERADVHADGVLAVPDDPGRVGWWTGGAQVGEPFGSVVLAGHVDSRGFGIGALAELLDVRPGARLRAGDGTLTREFRVESVVLVPKARLAEGTEAFRQDMPHRLVLITCGGEFDSSKHRYADNLVVTAVAVD